MLGYIRTRQDAKVEGERRWAKSQDEAWSLSGKTVGFESWNNMYIYVPYKNYGYDIYIL